MDSSKYRVGYFPVDKEYNEWVKKDHIEKPPVWCSVDMRDGNQSLVVPMNLEEKLEYYKVLLKVGFKEIEVGFPAANDTEYEFLRTLIDKDMIPDDVTVQVLTQCREHIIRKTFDACKGAPRAIIHFYNSVSVAQREQVFKKNKEEIKQIAVDGAKLVKKMAEEYEGNFRFEYSPESFTGTEPEYALEVCNAVLDVLEPSETNNVIINLPVTVEMSMPHVYASQVEYISKNLKYREFVTLSVHPHNDRGTGVADSELALLAGAERVEGTLFGNGERTGNVDIITLAMNMYSHGVNPGLDLSDVNWLVAKYERCTRMKVHERAPYTGALVFAAFSGSHQDAIAKGLKHREENNLHEWNVPYIPIDPKDIGRTYGADVIRVNSQSGKGGIGYLLERNFGYTLPSRMREDVSYTVKNISDKTHAELSPDEVLDIFTENYVNIDTHIKLVDYQFVRTETVRVTLTVEENGKIIELTADGNGRLDSVSNAIKKHLGIEFSELTYEEHALTKSSTSQAITYMSITLANGKKIWGVGIHDDILASSINALFSAVNRSMEVKI